MYLLAVSSRSSVLSAQPPVGYALTSAIVSSSSVLADTRWRTLVCFNPVQLRSTTGLSARAAAVCLWFLQYGLQLNVDKSEVVFRGTAAQLRSTANITTVDVAGSTLPVAPQLKSVGHRRLQLAVRLPSEKRCEGLQLPHSRTAPRAQPSDRRRRHADSRVQHRCFAARLLQRPAVHSIFLLQPHPSETLYLLH